MADAGERFADEAQKMMEARFRRIYRQAQEELTQKLDAHTKKYHARDVEKRHQLDAGLISQADYDHWLNGQVFIGKQWQDKVTSCATSLLYANQQANDIVEGQKRAVFGENATFQAFQMEKDAGMDLSFSIYDSATVTRLIREQPQLLPPKKVDAGKDMAWNRHKIAGCVTQGIIQGESIDQIARRIAATVPVQNEEAMVRYARTAMTGAQNAGRMEMLHDAQDIGIKVRKKWMATLDARTRDAHANLDGQEQEVDDPFESDLGPIEYPGDFGANPANVWNCRCTLTYVYPEYLPQNAQRLAYNEDRTESELIPDMTYNEWKAWKTAQGNTFEPENGKNNNASEMYPEIMPYHYESDDLIFQQAGISKIEGEHTSIEDLQKVNPDFDPLNPETSENCQRCVLAYTARRKGFDVEAERIYGYAFSDELAVNHGWKRVFDSREGFEFPFTLGQKGVTGHTIRDGVIDIVQKNGNGSIHIVDITWDGSITGHVFIAENYYGEVRFLDPQNPASDISTYWERIDPKATRVFRVDDKPFNDGVLKGVKKAR